MPRRPDSPCSRCGKLLWRGSTSAASPVCRECRHEPHGVAGYEKRGCRCAECTEAKRQKELAYRQRRRAEGRPVKFGRVDLRECEYCGVEFESRRGRRFCSIECVGASHRRGGPRRERKSAKRRAAERLAAKAAAGTTGGRRVWVQGACLVCGNQFPPSPGLDSRYCSSGCRTVARMSARWIDYGDRVAIYRRDGWCCQICGEAMSRRYDRADPWSPTLDHIVPRSAGGSDEVSNLRSAHMWCNSVRGDLRHFTDGELLGV